MRWWGVCAGMLLGVIPAAIPPNPRGLAVPPMDASEEGWFVTYGKEGSQRHEGSWTMSRELSAGRSLVRFVQKAQGQYGPFKRPVRWSEDSTWEVAGKFRPLKLRRQYFDQADGKLLITEFTEFDHQAGEARFRRTDRTGKRSLSRSLKVPPDTLAISGIALALRGLPFRTGGRVRVHILTDEPRVYAVDFRVAEREAVQTPAGRFNSYRVEMEVSAGFLGLFKLFVPQIEFWFAADEPHHWIRYVGLENGRGTQEVDMKLVALECSPVEFSSSRVEAR